MGRVIEFYFTFSILQCIACRSSIYVAENGYDANTEPTGQPSNGGLYCCKHVVSAHDLAARHLEGGARDRLSDENRKCVQLL